MRYLKKYQKPSGPITEKDESSWWNRVVYNNANPGLGEDFISGLKVLGTMVGLSDRGKAPVRDEEYAKKYFRLPYNKKYVPDSKYRPINDEDSDIQYVGVDDLTKHRLQQFVDTNDVKKRIQYNKEAYKRDDISEKEARNYYRTGQDLEEHLDNLREMYANPYKTIVVKEKNAESKGKIKNKDIIVNDNGIGFLKDFSLTYHPDKNDRSKDQISIKDSYDFTPIFNGIMQGKPYEIYDRFYNNPKTLNYQKRFEKQK